MMLLAMALALAAGAATPDYAAIGACAARANPRAAQAALEAAPGAGGDALDRVFARCGAGTDAARPLLLGATAEAMIRRYSPATDFARMYRPATADDRSVELMRRGTAGFDQADAVGTCVVRFDPGHAQALFRVRPGSRGEERAIRDQGPALRNCVDSGIALRASRAELRAGIARAFYRLYVAPVTDYGL